MALQSFLEDEAGYRQWRDSHPGAFILNHDRRPSQRYLVLHRVSCTTMQDPPSRGELWTFAFAKTCSDTARELIEWSRRVAGVEPRACRLCQPTGQSRG